MTSLISAGVYLGFVVLALLAWAARRASEATARRRISALIGYVVFASFLAGLSQRNLWPFAHWRMMQTVAPEAVGDSGLTVNDVVGVTAQGAEYPVDYRALEPFTYEELLAWLMLRFPAQPPPARDSVGAFLLRSSEAGREAARAGKGPGRVSRLLGSFAAPSHVVYARRWNGPDDVPATPFVAVRIYREYWNIEERARDPHAIRRRLLYQFPGPE